ncbi:MAG TPA: 3-hydroxyacyl-CoA dehydrogenase NAD-binding domain-containing protein [Acidimicrobiales bacterium]|nr:3-hydroxyacyl-CoA dehydrogenase NAD-binding domain-containing protein [Acidimicrobiales bacterium]
MTIPETTAVIGAGTMGPGIAATLSRCGSAVRLNDVDESVLERAKGATDLAAQVLGRLDAPSAPGGSVSFEPDLEKAVAGANLVIEAVPEKLELKREVFAKFEEHVSNETILATNTSGIPISDIAAELKHPERVIGMHWSNPPHLIPMIEVVPGKKTSDEVRDSLVEIINAFGFAPVVEKEVPGFVENRILYAILRECVSLVERGIVTQADMDTAVKWGIGYKLSVIGPMRLLDMAGLDIYQSVSSYLNRDLSNEAGVSPLITERTSQGKLGMKTLGGMYDYADNDDVAKRRAEIAAGLVAVRKTLSSL